MADVQDAEGMNGKLLEAAQKEAEKVIIWFKGILQYMMLIVGTTTEVTILGYLGGFQPGSG